MPTDAHPYLARTLSRLRRQAGLTRNELALLADVSRQAVTSSRTGDALWRGLAAGAVVGGFFGLVLSGLCPQRIDALFGPEDSDAAD